MNCAELRVLERRVLDLLVEIAPLVVANKVRADIFVAGSFCRLRLVFKAAEERLRDVLLKVHPRILSDDLFPQIFREVLVSDAENIEADTVVEQLNLNGLVSGDTRRRVTRDRVPSNLNAGCRYVVMLEELANCVRAVNLEAIVSTRELLQKAHVVEGRTEKEQLLIILLAGLTAQLVCPEEDAMGVVEQQRSAEFM